MDIKGTVSSLNKKALKFDIYEKPKEILTDEDLYKIHLISSKCIPNTKHNYVKFDYVELFFKNDRYFKRSVKNTLFTKINKLEDYRVKIFNNHLIVQTDRILSKEYCEIPNDYNNHEVYIEFEEEK